MKTFKSTMGNFREKRRNELSYCADPNKSICASAVSDWFGVTNVQRYMSTISDLVKAVRTEYTVRSRGSLVKYKTIGAARSILEKNTKNKDLGAIGYIIRVANHVILLNRFGQTLIDTDPRKRDRRTITHCYIVY
jgi:hypothetical protein